MTVGSPLTASFNPGSFVGDPATLVNFMLPEPGATATSPVTGTIVSWRITQATGGPFRLRVLTPGGGTYTGAGTSAPETPSSTATQTFTANLPISAGQLIGLDQTNGADEIGVAGVPGAGWGFWDPPLADGATLAGSNGSSDTELGFNADVQVADPGPPTPADPGPPTPATPSPTPSTSTPGPTGLRAAALKKCKHKHGQARAKCKKKANALPT